TQANVDLVRNHPLIPKDVPVHGLVIDPHTGKLDLVVDGYKKLNGMKH
ncbi:carbonic anhydrase, partial [Bacillus mobilis]